MSTESARKAAAHDKQIVEEAMNHHNKHYWCLVRTLQQRRKGWSDLADLIGEGSTVAQAIWNKYINMEVPNDSAACQTVATPRCPGCWSSKVHYLSTELKVICEGCFARFYVWKLAEFAQFFHPAPSPPEWISVKERMPDEDTKVLIAVQVETDDHSTGASVRWPETVRGTIYTAPNMVIADTDEGEFEDEEILGWQPLPAAPSPQGESK